MMKFIVLLPLKKLGYYNTVLAANLLFKQVERLQALLGLLLFIQVRHLKLRAMETANRIVITEDLLDQ